MLQTAREPRLRDAALAGAFAREPARWYARLVARSDSGSLIARNALRLAEGVGATWPAAPQTPMPQAGADWRTWLVWLGNEVRWEHSHRHALVMYSARTGRNPVEELRRTWPPDADSARLVIGTILRGMDALAEPTADELAAALLSASAADRQAAQRVLADMMQRNGAPASDSLRSELLIPLLDAIARGGNSPWLPTPADGARLHPFMVDFHGVNDVPVFVL